MAGFGGCHQSEHTLGLHIEAATSVRPQREGYSYREEHEEALPTPPCYEKQCVHTTMYHEAQERWCKGKIKEKRSSMMCHRHLGLVDEQCKKQLACPTSYELNSGRLEATHFGTVKLCLKHHLQSPSPGESPLHP